MTLSEVKNYDNAHERGEIIVYLKDLTQVSAQMADQAGFPELSMALRNAENLARIEIERMNTVLG